MGKDRTCIEMLSIARLKNLPQEFAIYVSSLKEHHPLFQETKKLKSLVSFLKIIFIHFSVIYYDVFIFIPFLTSTHSRSFQR
jgi:hypothetical protein